MLNACMVKSSPSPQTQQASSVEIIHGCPDRADKHMRFQRTASAQLQTARTNSRQEPDALEHPIKHKTQHNVLQSISADHQHRAIIHPHVISNQHVCLSSVMLDSIAKLCSFFVSRAPKRTKKQNKVCAITYLISGF